MLTKAKCVFALAGLYSAADGEHDEENKDVLEQLIKEHFILKKEMEEIKKELEWYKEFKQKMDRLFS